MALAQRFDAISVREGSGVDLCRDYLGVSAQCVLDPTLLLEAKDYQAIIDKDWDAKEPYLAVYCLDLTPEKESLFNQLAKSRGLKVQYYSAGWQSTLTVEQWLAMIKNATVPFSASSSRRSSIRLSILQEGVHVCQIYLSKLA